MASSSSSFNNPPEKTKHDVFLSFRGEDTRNNFTSHVNAALRWAKIVTFIDNQLNRGDEISPALVTAIEESKISIIIFSVQYASSKWCLQELVKILDCRKKNGQIVIPIFYHIDPSHVRSQTGIFGDGFAKLQQRYVERLDIKLLKWKTALTEAASISGWHLDGTKCESDIVEEVVQHVLRILSYMYPSDDKHLVGVGSRIKKIEFLLRIGSKDVRIVGIWGMGGIGKTTIARAVFNKIFSRFEDSFFALNVGEELEAPNGLICLQQKLLSTFLKDRNADIGCTLTRQRLGRTKVLIVFDDVESRKQIEDLIGDLNCFGLGSRIIITTRNKQVLKSCRVDDNNIYKVEGLSQHEALQLFSWHAFQQKYPILGYHEMSDTVVKYSKGVPLALRVWGSTLFGKTEQVWRSAIKKLKRVLHTDIQDELMISYDGLDDPQKNIFLDIACFLKWENKDLVIKFLDANGFQSEFEIDVLVDKCLISELDNKITIHDLLEELGKGIVQASSKYPYDRSRLWYHEDIYPILEENMGTKAIEGICFDMFETSNIQLRPHVFKEMRYLRILKIYNSYCEKNNTNKLHVSQDLESNFTKLSFLSWHGCPLKSLELNFYPQKLVVLDMPYSIVEELWTGAQNLVNLKSINLSHSKNLLKIPDLSLAKNLESLILEGCTSLLEISPSIQCLENLVILNLRHCKSLLCLPSGIYAESLRKVMLSYCSNLTKFPDISNNVEELFLDETAIEELPSSIENLSKLTILNVKNCSRLDSLPKGIFKLKSLQHLNLSGCLKVDGLLDQLEALQVLKARSTAYLRFLMELNLTDCCITELPNSLSQLYSLKKLLLGRNKFRSVHKNIICHLSRLAYLDLSYCKTLEAFPDLPFHLQQIDAHNCTSLKALPGLSILSQTISRNARFNFINCSKLGQKALGDAMQDALEKIRCLDDYKEFYPRPSACICFPGTEIPEWFKYQSLGAFISLELQSDWFNPEFVNFAMCAVVEFQNYHNKGQGFAVGCEFKLRSNNETILYRSTLRGWYYGTGPEDINSDHVFLGYDFHMCPFGCYNRMIVQFYAEDLNGKQIDWCKVKKCGLNLLYKTINQEQEGPLMKRLKLSKPFQSESCSRYNIYTRKRQRETNQPQNLEVFEQPELFNLPHQAEVAKYYKELIIQERGITLGD